MRGLVFRAARVSHTTRHRTGSDTPVAGEKVGHNHTIGDGEPSVLLFDLKVSHAWALCALVVAINVVLLFTGLRVLFDILLRGWGVRHDVQVCFRIAAARDDDVWLRSRAGTLAGTTSDALMLACVTWSVRRCWRSCPKQFRVLSYGWRHAARWGRPSWRSDCASLLTRRAGLAANEASAMQLMTRDRIVTMQRSS